MIHKEYTFGKGFNYTEMLVEELWALQNTLKTRITNPTEENKDNSWLSYWHGAQGETHAKKEQLDKYTSWWKNHFDIILTEILSRKDEYNKQIIELFSNSLID